MQLWIYEFDLMFILEYYFFRFSTSNMRNDRTLILFEYSITLEYE